MTQQVPAAQIAHEAAASRDAGGLTVSRVRPAYQQVADQLLELILTGALSSGDRLPPESGLASRFGVSRSTVREALRVLASRDLVHTTRGTRGGTFVSRVRTGQISEYLESSLGLMSGTPDMTVDEMLEARELIEVPATRLAAQRRQPHHVEAMRQAIARERPIRGRVERFREHRNFHGVLADAAGNGLVTMMLEPLFRVLQARFLNPDVVADFWEGVDQAHTVILAAVEQGDGDAASEAMRVHLIALRQAYRQG